MLDMMTESKRKMKTLEDEMVSIRQNMAESGKPPEDYMQQDGKRSWVGLLIHGDSTFGISEFVLRFDLFHAQ